MPTVPGVAPTIVAQISDQVAVVGAATTFSVSARGTAPLSYQWLRDGSPIAGATAPSFTLPAAHLSDAKSNWRVVVSNGTGSVSSATAHLRVSGIDVLAGSIGTEGATDGPAASARFYRPAGLVFGTAGNLYVADYYGAAIRKIGADGIVSTFAGFGATGPSATAHFNRPAGIAMDTADNLYVADEFNHSLRKVTPAGVVTTVMTPSTGFGDGRDDEYFYATGAAVDGAGNLYLETGRNTRKLAPSGVVTLLEGRDAPLTQPVIGTPVYWLRGIAVASDGTVFTTGGACITKITPSGARSTIAGSASCTLGAGDKNFIPLNLYAPAAIARDQAGNLFVADSPNHVIYKLTPDGVATIVAGRLGVAGIVTGAFPGGLDNPLGITVDASGTLYVATGSVVLQIVLP